MPVKKIDSPQNLSTEAKIRAAARTVFHKKGFAATRTRDIAEEAGINLALLNYYFRSKEKLFQIIMMETMKHFMNGMIGVFNDEKTNLESKIQRVAISYIDLMIKDPEIPLFILSEIRANVDDFFSQMPIAKVILNSALMRQYKKAQADGEISNMEPIHFLINLMSMIVFPFAAAPMLKKVASMTDPQYQKMMEDRKVLIPIWINTLLKP
jgi:AcrR family transcriptional regulator